VRGRVCAWDYTTPCVGYLASRALQWPACCGGSLRECWQNPRGSIANTAPHCLYDRPNTIIVPRQSVGIKLSRTCTSSCSSRITLMAKQILRMLQSPCKMQFGCPFGQWNFLAYMMHWLHTQEFPLPPFVTRNRVHCLKPFSPSLAARKTGGGHGRLRHVILLHKQYNLKGLFKV